MKTSARNKFEGKISKIEQKGLIVDIELTTKDGLAIKTAVTHTSFKNLKLEPEKNCTALVKAPMVRIFPLNAMPQEDLTNCYKGVVSEIKSDKYAIEITGAICNSQSFCSVYPASEMPFSGIEKGLEVKVAFSPASVILIEE